VRSPPTLLFQVKIASAPIVIIDPMGPVIVFVRSGSGIRTNSYSESW
jgi:hypothetical protein